MHDCTLKFENACIAFNGLLNRRKGWRLKNHALDVRRYILVER